MSTTVTCRSGFVESNWNKELCSNCFRTRDEHTNSSTSINLPSASSNSNIEMNSSGFYGHPWPTSNSTGSVQSGPSVAIQVKNPSYGLPTSSSASQVAIAKTNGATGLQQMNSSHQNPVNKTHTGQQHGSSSSNNVISGRTVAVSNINRYNNGNNVRQSTAIAHSYGGNMMNRGGTGGNYHHAMTNGLPSSNGRVITSSTGGINVTVNGTSNSNIKKYVQQHPPQPAVRTSLPNNRIHSPSSSNSIQNGLISSNFGSSNGTNGLNGVSVSVNSKSSSYSNNLHTIGVGGIRSMTTTSTGGTLVNTQYSSNVQQQRHLRTIHPLTPTTTNSTATTSHSIPYGKNFVGGTTSGTGLSSSVPVLTQSRTHNHSSTQNNQQYVNNILKHPQQASSVLSVHSNIMERSPSSSTVLASVTNVPTIVEQSKITLYQSVSKGILRKDDGIKRKLSVTFPQDVCAVIGYGGSEHAHANCASEDESEEETPSDPLDSSSVPEILEKSSISILEKELHRVTIKNTNFNSIKTNLLGYAPIEIGPITGGTGGKSKPVVSIGTFETRKEPVKSFQSSKNIKSPLSKTVTTVASSNNSSSNVKSISNSTKLSAISHLETEKGKAKLNQSSNTLSSRKGKGSEQQPQSHASTMITSKPATINTSKPATGSVEVTSSETRKQFSKLPLSSSLHQPLQKSSSVTETTALSTTKESTTNVIVATSARTLTSSNTQAFTDIIQNKDKVHLTEQESRLGFLNSTLHTPEDSLEENPPPRVIKSELKLELINPTIQSVHNNSYTEHSTNCESYEDDSLEADSGLDTSKRTTKLISDGSVETSESDTEKSGSNSDSGNENDFIDRRGSSSQLEKGGSCSHLFVSIEQDNNERLERGNLTKPAKLSPDSVISSEMSSTSPVDSTNGSNESIPNKIEEELKVEKNYVSTPPKSRNAIIPPSLKRTAPLPPTLLLPAPPSQKEPHIPYSTEGLYDDVEQRPISTKIQGDFGETIADPEESLYDDCTGISAGMSSEPTGSANAKASYDFTDSTMIGNDPELDEGVAVKQNEGIEFLGIRKIDSESLLNAKESNSTNNSDSSTNASKTEGRRKDRFNSESPKPKKRVVNQFFSTIGKRAGAAFNRSPNHTSNDFSPISKTTSVKNSTNPNHGLFNSYKRSMSQDEVSMTRTQELYATLTPTSLKSRGLNPVLNKLTKLELHQSKDAQDSGNLSERRKGSKFSNSIKKFLGFGSNGGKNLLINGESENGGASSTPTKKSGSSLSPRSSPPRQEHSSQDLLAATSTINRPPPPPPRVHSLDMLSSASTLSKTSTGVTTGKPARPPPPKMNQVAPSFVSVFSTLPPLPSTPNVGGIQDDTGIVNGSEGYGNFGSNIVNPPNKPKRKASLCQKNDDGGAYTANYLETTYNHITSLNFETLKLIASQDPAKIKRSSIYHHQSKLSSNGKIPIRWSQFFVTDVLPLTFGKGYAFYSSFWEDEPCTLLIQESLASGVTPLEFNCVEVFTSFEDVIQQEFVPWDASDFVVTGNGIRVFISVLACCTVQKLSEYINNANVTVSRKFYAILEAMNFWGKEEISNLLVFYKIPTGSELVEEPSGYNPNKSKSSPSPNFGLIFVRSSRIKSNPSNSLLTFHPSREIFQNEMQELLFNTIVTSSSSGIGTNQSNDQDILLKRLNGSTTEEVEAQLQLYLQLKLFGPQSSDLDKILRYRSEKQVIQWMDKERAYCMNDALKRSLERNSEPISPLRKSFVEFLMISDTCAKTVLDFIVDLYPDS